MVLISGWWGWWALVEIFQKNYNYYSFEMKQTIFNI